jgi:hypothetical protein
VSGFEFGRAAPAIGIGAEPLPLLAVGLELATGAPLGDPNRSAVQISPHSPAPVRPRVKPAPVRPRVKPAPVRLGVKPAPVRLGVALLIDWLLVATLGRPPMTCWMAVLCELPVCWMPICCETLVWTLWLLAMLWKVGMVWILWLLAMLWKVGMVELVLEVVADLVPELGLEVVPELGLEVVPELVLEVVPELVLEVVPELVLEVPS